MVSVVAYDFWNNEHKFEVKSESKAREYAKRIITEGLWYTDDEGCEIFLPVHNVVKVKITK